MNALAWLKIKEHILTIRSFTQESNNFQIFIQQIAKFAASTLHILGLIFSQQLIPFTLRVPLHQITQEISHF